ncbi:PKD domain-containing protein [Flaviaesturariibacter amylovorans]|uniref:PKD domain-containing protein n=1 Tax=Flaviaesturariibacter amylovorans TaxID=1084520 RepID=A0ABP8HBL0_9BACT
MNRFLFLLAFLLPALSGAAQLTANFNSDVTQGCSPVVVNFRDQSTGNPTTWSWDFGNGSTSTLQHPSATYFTTGTYTVKLTVTNNNGASTNTVTKTAYITVLTEPQPNFVADRTEGCSPAVINFTDQSSTPGNTTITNWQWDFGDGQSATGPNVQHAYRQAGSFTVTLTITNNAGCKKLYSRPNYINVNPGVAPRFTYTDPGVCRAPATVNFNNTSFGPGTLTHTWYFGDGTTSNAQSPAHTYSTNGTYQATLVVSSSLGCSDSMVQSVPVGLVNTDLTIPDKLCPRTSTTFMNASDPRPVSSRWYFSNGIVDTLPNATAYFDAPGTYTVKLVNNYQTCVDSVERTFTVGNGPVLGFTVSDSTRCQPSLNVNFTNTSTGATGYTWLFGDNTNSTQASPSHTYGDYGAFDVTLIGTDSTGCSDTLRRPGLIRIERPKISFIGLPRGGCVPDTASFKADVQTSGTVTSWLWNFGDGSATSTQDSTSHIYTQQGTYNVTLTITTSEGCTETYTLNEAIRVGTKPIPEFVGAPLTACADPGVTFTNQSTGATDYSWNFGDGTSSTEVNPVHVFADTGYFDITLTAINNGCREPITKSRYVYIQPSVSRFIWRTDCNNYRKIIFTNKSLGAQTSVWDFGDGTAPYTGTTPPAHTYAADGTYQVKLTTTNGNCTYTLTKNVLVTDPTPRLFADDSAGCRPFNASFRAESNNPGVFRKFQWTFGDGSPVDTSQGATASHLYTVPGTYDVKVVAIDTSGCRYELTRPDAVSVNGPIARFGAVNPRGCAGSTVEFADSSISNGGSIRTWIFEFGDSTRVTYTAPPFTHTYDSVGDYDVKMVVIDSAGCSDSLMIRGLVRTSKLTANFTALTEYCPRAPLYFPNLTESDLPFTSFWQFGDGQTSTDYNARNSFRDTGYYSVTLTVTDLLGCKDSLTVDSFHIRTPKADFTANAFTTYCTPFQALFTNQSEFYYGAHWNFGPGQGTSDLYHPYTYYTQPGIYPVKLVITAHGGCKDSVTKNIEVRDQSDATLDYAPLNGCTPLNVNFNAFAPIDSARFVWDFGDGNVIDTTVNALVHRYTDFGDFRPKIIMKEATGTCVILIEGTKIISLLGAHAEFTLDTMQFCDRGLITTNSDSTTSNDPIVQYSWTFGDGSAPYTTQAPTHNYTEPGTYEVIMAVRTQAGCTDTMRKGPVRVFETPRFAIQADTSICRDARVTYVGQPLNSDTATWNWNWVFPNGSTSGQQNPTPQVYKTPGSYQVRLSAVSPLSGCRDTVIQSMMVHDLPTITLPETLSKFVGVPAILPAQYSSGVQTYNWSPANDLNCTDCPQPVATPKFTTRYTVTATDSNSCRNSASIQLIVLCQGAKIFVPNTFSPNGDGANDVFGIQGSGMARVKSLRVFNRWGEVVFERRDFPVNDAGAGWDGTYKGQKAAPDVYIYQLEVYCENSDVIRTEGNVALIR